MKTHLQHHLLAALLDVVFTAEVRAQGTAFTYEDQLTESAGPGNDSFDFPFLGFHAASGGGSQCGLITTTPQNL